MDAARHDLENVSTIPREEYESRRAACADILAERRLAALVVSDPGDLRFLIGHTGTTDLGPSPFSGAIGAALVIAQDGKSVFVIGQPESSIIWLDAVDVERFCYETFTDLTALRPRVRLATGVATALERLAMPARAAVGYDASSLTAAVVEDLRERLPRFRIVDVDGLVSRLRMTKSPAEIGTIRRCVEVCDMTQLALRERVTPGMTQVEILDIARAAVEQLTGARRPIVLEASYGSASEGYGAGRELREGDLLLTDIAPQVDGYWADSCDTRPLGEPSTEGHRMIRTIGEALVLGTEAARPGVSASRLDEIMRRHVGLTYPPYQGTGGHGIGLDYHESPRLIPDEELVLEEGMVLALEPGVYLETAMARIEHLVLIAPGGCEVLSRHLDWHAGSW